MLRTVYRGFTAMVVAVALLSAGLARADTDVQWTGQGVTGGALNTVDCSTLNPGQLLWVFTFGQAPGTTITDANTTLTINGTDVYSGSQFGGAIHFITPFYTLNPSLTIATVHSDGDTTGNPQLVISHGCPATPPQVAKVRACKFEDLDASGVWESGEPFLSGWTINATGAVNGSNQTQTAPPLSKITDGTGCVEFNVKDLNGPVTLSETEQEPAWTQTAAYCPDPLLACTESNGVITLPSPLVAGNTYTVYFGNFKFEEGGVLSVEKTAIPDPVNWNIAKDVDKTTINIAEGGTATFNYTVNVTHQGTGDLNGVIQITNSKPVQFDHLKVTDSTDQGGTCTITPDASDLTVPASTVNMQLLYNCVFTDVPAAPGTNTVSITNASDTELAFGQAPFQFVPANPKTVTVTDSVEGPLGSVNVGDASPKSFPYSKSLQGVPGTCTTYDNTATITETTQTSSKTVTVCVGKDLTVSKTATPSYTRTYNWSIAKSVDKTLVEQIGGNATFNYSVDVAATGFTDSAWKVTGSITVTNPNDWEAITFDLSDAIDNGGNCTIDGGGTGLSVVASGTVTKNYTCTYASAPSPSAFTNTATATWNKATYSTPTGTASGLKTGAFGDPTSSVNKTITVTDTYGGTLGTVTATDSTPYAAKTYTYSRTVAVPASNCVTYDNTATITETSQSSSKTVKVCGPAKTGALTMGFWQNKNGQALITGAGPASGTCSLTAGLRAYAPFQDLSATATCAQVATYVTNVIKAANASGAAMNAMLKGQMLATTLDVILNQGPGLGSMVIDLTKINKPIGSNTFENTSAAFGGATSMSVSGLLSFASGQSNSGGTTWYGNVKATQELAKDTFDAINNEKAFSP